MTFFPREGLMRPVEGGAHVAAGAVVTKSFPANSLIGGVPAKLIREDVSWQ